MVVDNAWFECIISFVIVVNSVMLGVESQMSLSGNDVGWSWTAEIFFLVIFSGEILLRLIANGWKSFRDGWFVFDLSLVLTAYVEQTIQFFTASRSEQQVLVLRTMRLFRLIRTFRMIKQIKSHLHRQDGSGEVDLTEMVKFEEDGLVPSHLLDRASVDSMADLFNTLDVDGSGKINRSEFIEGLLNIFLREVPVSTLQMLKMQRLLRDKVTHVEEDVLELQDLLSVLRAEPRI
eukprot:g32461.t1